MGTAIQAGFGVLALIVLFTPAGLLIYASVGLFRSKGGSAALLVAIGGVLLTVASLDFLYSFATALLLGPEELAAYSIIAVYVGRGLNYMALLLIGIGLVRLTRGQTAVMTRQS